MGGLKTQIKYCRKHSKETRALGMGLMDPRTEIDSLALKLHIGNIIMNEKIHKAIKMQDEYDHADSELKINSFKELLL